MLRYRLASGVQRPSRATVERSLLAGGFLVLFAALPHALESDDVTRFDDIQQLLNHGRLTDSKHSLLMPLVSAPVILLGHLVESPAWWAARFNVLVVVVGALVARSLLRDRVDAGLLRRTLLVLLFASLFTNRLRAYDPEVLSATLIAIGIACLATRRHVVAGWPRSRSEPRTRPPSLSPSSRRRHEAHRTKRLRPFAWLAAAAALVAAEAWIRRGSPIGPGLRGRPSVRHDPALLGAPRFQLSVPARPRLACVLVRAWSALLHARPRPVAGLAHPRGGRGLAPWSSRCCSSSPGWCSPMRSGGRGTAASSGGHASSPSPPFQPRC